MISTAPSPLLHLSRAFTDLQQERLPTKYIIDISLENSHPLVPVVSYRYRFYGGATVKELPSSYRRFREDFSPVWEAFDNLGERCHQAGPLEAKARRLVKLGIAIGAGLEGTVHSHTRRALAEGITPEARSKGCSNTPWRWQFSCHVVD